ncbi:hypothetical protein QEN19_000266 [Hanseniaspora menglaensis]
MPYLFQRKLMQVLPGQADESTRTLSSVSNEGHYVSLRPFIKAAKDQEEFPFESCFAGFNKSCIVSKIDEKTTKQTFLFDIHSNRVLGIPLQDAPLDTYWTTWVSGDIEERGTIHPNGPENEGIKFIELWQPIKAETYLSKDNFLVGSTDSTSRSITLKMDSEQYYGIVVIVGDVVQGLLHKKKAKDISVLRCVVDKDTLRFKKYEIKFGEDLMKFPIEVPSSITVGSFINGWEIIES